MGISKMASPEHVKTCERLLKTKRLLSRLYELTVRSSPLGFADDRDVRLMAEVARSLDAKGGSRGR